MLYKILILLSISTVAFGQFTSDHTGNHIDSVITGAETFVYPTESPSFWIGQGADSTVDVVSRLEFKDTLGITVSVKDYGAKGDGTTNDSSAFAQALATGNSVFVPEGSYVTGRQELIYERQKLFGAGKGSTRIIPTDWADTLFVLKNWECDIGNFYMRTNFSTTSLDVIISIDSVATASNVHDLIFYWMKNADEDCVALQYTSTTNSAKVWNVTFIYGNIGINFIQRQSDFYLTNSRLLQNFPYNMWLQDAEDTPNFAFTIDGCDIEQSSDAGNPDTSLARYNIRIDSPHYQLRINNTYTETSHSFGSRVLYVNDNAEIFLDGVYFWGNNESTHAIYLSPYYDITLRLRNVRIQQYYLDGMEYEELPNHFISYDHYVQYINGAEKTIYFRPYMPRDSTDVTFAEWYSDTTDVIRRVQATQELLPQAIWTDSVFFQSTSDDIDDATFYPDSIVIDKTGNGIAFSQVHYWEYAGRYECSITVTEDVASTGNLTVFYDGSGGGLTVTEAGTFTHTYIADSRRIVFQAFDGAKFTITNLSIKYY